MDWLLSHIGPILLLLIVADGFALMFGKKLPATRAAFRLSRLAIGGLFIYTGTKVRGGKKK
ncbi:MAG: hypothetical protein Q7T01_03170 [bacterium]|nr:hypothetical protein [bacterium]